MSDPIFPIINLPNRIEIQKSINTNQIEILQTIDDPRSRTVKSLVKISSDPYAHNWYSIWSGDEYDQIGQWTDTQLTNKIISFVTGEYPQAIVQ